MEIKMARHGKNHTIYLQIYLSVSSNQTKLCFPVISTKAQFQNLLMHGCPYTVIFNSLKEKKKKRTRDDDLRSRNCNCIIVGIHE